MGISNVGVIGAGTMGNGIAQVCAAAGINVVLMDISDEALQRGVSVISESLDRQAMSIALLGESLDADQAMKFGQVNRVVPGQDLSEVTDAVMAHLANGPTFAYGQTKRLFRSSFGRAFDAQLSDELAAFRASAATHDFVEGVSAFIEKRKAVQFSGA